MGIDKDKSLLKAATDLRRLAEERLRSKNAQSHVVQNEKSENRISQELEIHQIELEMQNAEMGQARDQVEAALEKYTDLYDFAPVGYFTLDRSGVISAVNITGAALLGVERSRLSGKRFSLFIPGKTGPVFSEFLDRVFTSQVKQSCEMTLKTNGNSLLCVRIDAVVCTSGQECLVATIDITARKRAEAENLQKSMRLAWVLEKTLVGMWLNEFPLGHLQWDAQTRVLFFVDSEADTTMDLFWSRVYPDDHDATRQAIDSAINDHTLYDTDFRVVNPATGEIRWLHSTGQVSYSADGTPIRFDGINYDITVRKQNEILIQSYNENLRDTNEELNRFNCASVGRELRMIELKKEINGLCRNFGQPPRYTLDFEKELPL